MNVPDAEKKPLSAEKQTAIAPMGINESPTLFKHGGRYYMITSRCNGWAPSDARLFTAKSIMGPWELLDNPCVGPEERTKITFETQNAHVLPVQGKKMPLFLWRTAGVQKMRSTAATSGCPSSSTRPASPSSNGGTNGIWESLTPVRRLADKFTHNGRMLRLAGPSIDELVSGYSATVEIGGGY